MKPSVSEQTRTEDNLVIGGTPLETVSAVIASGENVAVGAAMGRVTADGKWKLSATAAGDGSEVIRGIMAEAVDASGGDETGVVYTKGKFNKSKVSVGTGHDLDDVATQNGLTDRGLIIAASA